MRLFDVVFSLRLHEYKSGSLPLAVLVVIIVIATISSGSLPLKPYSGPLPLMIYSGCRS